MSRVDAAERAVIAVVILAVPAWWIGVQPALEHREFHRQCRNAYALRLILRIEVAAEQYERDHGAYPPGDGTGSAEAYRLLTQPRPGGMPYLDATPGRTSFINPADGVEEIRYLNPGVHNLGRIDIWCTNAEGTEMAINNWME